MSNIPSAGKDSPALLIVVTGATGFVGTQLCAYLAASGYRVRGVTTKDPSLIPPLPSVTYVRAGRSFAENAWADWLHGASGVVHLAALVHRTHGQMREEDYDAMNHRGTRLLAQHAGRAGVRNFVFLSTVKVNGDASPSAGYNANQVPHPTDAYSRSKLLAEQALQVVSQDSGMAVDVIRPPLIYGPGVGANFLKLMHWVQRGYPLPFGSINNRRSLVSTWNLCDLIGRLLSLPARGGGTWMVSDGEDVSTPALIRKIAAALSVQTRLLRIPAPLLLAGGRLVGMGESMTRLCDSLTVDMVCTRQELCWDPPLDMNAGLSRTAAWFVGRSG